MKYKRSPKVLVAPLNWGLGHLTRCVPLIRTLQQKADVCIASDGQALALSQKEFPQLEHRNLPSYNITYKTSNMLRNIAPQLPRIYKAIQSEHKILQNWQAQKTFDLIISDNRYGMYHTSTPSIIMTHQLQIQTPKKWMQPFVRQTQNYFLKKFNTCWVVDNPPPHHLAGALSDAPIPIPKVYLGALSRFHQAQLPTQYDLAVVLSGPEPQRTYLTEKLMPQLHAFQGKILLVLGQPATHQQDFPAPHIERHNFLTAQTLNQKLLQSRVILARAGYSTIMDLQVLQKPAILIPTPGQTEQEYLAQNLAAQNHCVYQNQHQINLQTAYAQALQISPPQSPQTPRFHKAIDDLLAKV